MTCSQPIINFNFMLTYCTLSSVKDEKKQIPKGLAFAAFKTHTEVDLKPLTPSRHFQ